MREIGKLYANKLKYSNNLFGLICKWGNKFVNYEKTR